ncbi:MAG: hypothetical protein ACM3SW_14960, partial [Actinomycetota bacterium]
KLTVQVPYCAADWCSRLNVFRCLPITSPLPLPGFPCILNIVARHTRAVLACVLLTGIALVCVSPVCNLAPAALSGVQAASIILLLFSSVAVAACGGCCSPERIARTGAQTARLFGQSSHLLVLNCSLLC